ncbi:DUF2975 domain-containing protein [Gracilibacillus caseinilyticus]|uniref:DUF2975 domain-containing protein n=1 Tax=Gracilibacillus caseinilyticus TaxID=2932256 RepID=A0ABY4EZ17_9BACI|nr:DUF2975 domain-containing protein [Gracilibacillus caseinilyticus]UOQ49645.1 DUF2975 domain-containing protein [Gracilibacillus caseinilyticus]
MKRSTTLFLKIAIFLIGSIVISLSIFLLPKLANDTTRMFPEYAHLHYPVLIGLYVTTIPFFIAIFQAFKLLNYINNNNAFSELSVTALKYIKFSANTISALYVLGSIFLITQQALHPGIAIIGFIIIFASTIIAVFSAVLEKLLQNAIAIKSENDFIV